jgi:hypothetical protein
VNIPPGIGYEAPPLKLYEAVIVIGSPSSSTKYEARFILVLYECPKLISRGAVETSLGAIFPLTMLTVNVVVE